MKVGRVLWFDLNAGNGIIITSENIEYYTDISAIPDRKNLVRGQAVEFEENEKIKDCRCAIVTKIY